MSGAVPLRNATITNIHSSEDSHAHNTQYGCSVAEERCDVLAVHASCGRTVGAVGSSTHSIEQVRFLTLSVEIELGPFTSSHGHSLLPRIGTGNESHEPGEHAEADTTECPKELCVNSEKVTRCRRVKHALMVSREPTAVSLYSGQRRYQQNTSRSDTKTQQSASFTSPVVSSTWVVYGCLGEINQVYPSTENA